MKKVFRLIGLSLLGIFALVLIGVSTLFVLGNRKINKIHVVEGNPVIVEANAETLARVKHCFCD